MYIRTTSTAAGLKQVLSTSKHPLIVVLGPTASGKTAFSIQLAKAIPGSEVLNADSRQLYKYLDIGTAKITTAEMQGVTHHLLDVLDPKEPITAAWYKTRAEQIIDVLHTQNKVPILVGGSMLYISAIIDGLEFAGPVDKKIRAELTAEYDADSGQSLYAKLINMNPEQAARIPVQNKVYVIRAMEKELSRTSGTITPCPYEVFILGMEVEAAALAQKITERTAALFAMGWIDEVRTLKAKGYTSADPGFESHGYREILEWLVKPEQSEPELIAEIAAKSRQYAKRQRTWWRGDPRIHWLTPPELPELISELTEQV